MRMSDGHMEKQRTAREDLPKELHVLLLDGHTRQVLPMAKALRRNGYHTTVLCPSRFSVGYVSRWPSRRLLCPSAKENATGFLERLKEVLQQDKYDVVIPLFDYSAEIVCRHKDSLSRWSSMAINDYDVFMKARDKSQTMKICMENNIPCPQTFFPDESTIEDYLDGLVFPVAVKPFCGDSGNGFSRVDNARELPDVFRKTTREYGCSLIQQYIPQTDLQYKTEVFIGNDGEIKAAVVFSKVRYYPIDGGSSTLNITVERPDIVETCCRLLRVIGWRGYADVDLIQDPRDGVAKVMEINPRITGSVKIAFDAGVDFADMIVRSLLDEPVVKTDYEVGRHLRFFHKDVLWFIMSPDRFRAHPSWFSFFNSKTSDQILSLDDPIPGITFTLESLGRLLKDRGYRDKV